MDPVTSFGIAASALQVAEFGLKVLSNVREIYKTGSLTRRKEDEDISTRLRIVTLFRGPQSRYTDSVIVQSCTKLKSELEKTPNPESSDDQCVLDASVKCIEISQGLLKQLESIKQSRGNLLKALTAGVRNIRNRKLDEKQRLLERYRQDLHTCLAVRAETRAAESKHNEEVANFKSNFFFEKIQHRQETISSTYQDTYRWIFGSTSDCSVRENFGSLPGIVSEDEPNAVDFTEAFKSRNQDAVGSISTKRENPWNDFSEWLKTSQKLFWVSGKPGSGKSYLMKFLVRHEMTRRKLDAWAGNDGNTIILSHFFWKPGCDMQRSVRGLLCTLIYELCQLDEKAMLQTLRTDPHRNRKDVHEMGWSDDDLLNLLQRYLCIRSSSTKICVFVDGLDECLDEQQENLLDVLLSLGNSTNVKLCLSSRPERIFKLQLGQENHLRLEDLNYEDIFKTTSGKLLPVLEEFILDDDDTTIEHKDLFSFVETVAKRAEGVFQWLDIVIKELIRATKNLDSLSDLQKRLNKLPRSLEDLYAHLLNRLDYMYRADASIYFQLLMTKLELSHLKFRDLSILQFAFLEISGKPWQSVLGANVNYFTSDAFDKFCKKTEIRIQVCSAGLIDVGHRFLGDEYEDAYGTSRFKILPYDYHKERRDCKIYRHYRRVSFIHRSVVDFLNGPYDHKLPTASRESSCLTLYRLDIGLLHIIPILHDVTESGSRLGIITARSAVDQLFRALALWQPTNLQDASQQTALIEAAKLFPVLDSTLDGITRKFQHPDWTWGYMWRLWTSSDHPLCMYGSKRANPAAVSSSEVMLALYGIDLKKLLQWKRWDQTTLDSLLIFSVSSGSSKNSLARLKNVQALIKAGADPNTLICTNSPCEFSVFETAWSVFVARYGDMASVSESDRNEFRSLWFTVMEDFLSHGADVNDSILEMHETHVQNRKELDTWIYTERSLLSYIHSEVQIASEDSRFATFLRKTSALLENKGSIKKQSIPFVKFITPTKPSTPGALSPLELPDVSQIDLQGKENKLFRVPEDDSHKMSNIFFGHLDLNSHNPLEIQAKMKSKRMSLQQMLFDLKTKLSDTDLAGSSLCPIFFKGEVVDDPEIGKVLQEQENFRRKMN